jgi:transposase
VRPRRPTVGFPPDRRRGQRQPPIRDPARHRPRRHAAGGGDRRGLRREGQPAGGAAARRRGICPAIPHRSTTADRPGFFPKALYRGRARIEQTIGKLKRFKRIALRCEKTAENYAALVAFACTLILVKSVHTA